MVVSGEFKKYDYGSAEENIKAYGQETPPIYNTSNISGFKITLVCGKTDHMASKPDYDWVAELLKPNNEIKV